MVLFLHEAWEMIGIITVLFFAIDIGPCFPTQQTPLIINISKYFLGSF
jgi:hypothetical protein